MNITEAYIRLKEIADNQKAHRGATDIEADHSNADAILLELINSPLITKEYDRIRKWYA